MASFTTLASGVAAAIGSDLRAARSELVFVEFAGNLSRLNLVRGATTVSAGVGILRGTWLFDFDNGVEVGTAGPEDVWWQQATTVERSLVPRGGARLVNLGAVDFDGLTADTLQRLVYGSTPIPGNDDASNQLVVGDVFAVLTNDGNYAKVRVVAYGYDLKLEWVTFRLEPAYQVLGTGYDRPEDVKVAADEAHAYVVERAGNLLRVELADADRDAAVVVASGMTEPHQLFLDEAHGAAYVVEFASPGRLWRVDLSSGNKTALVSDLEFAVGLTLSADLQYAYVSEQTAVPDQGRVRRFQLASGGRRTLATNLTAPFFLTWADAAQTALLVPERHPSHRVLRVDVTSGTSNVVAAGVPRQPSSVAVLSPGRLLVCCDSVITEIDFTAAVFQPAGPLLMGIGAIPFDKVQPSGLADTSVDPAYFYQVKDTPFGGTLPIMVNHLRAFNTGAAYYRVTVDGTVRTDSWTDQRWDGFSYVAQTTGPTVVAGQSGCYPVHSVSELFRWYHPSLGSLLDSTNLGDGLHTIVLEFLDGVGALLETSAPLTIMIDNQRASAALVPPTLNGNGATAACGLLRYGVSSADPVAMGFTASHPTGFATFSFSLIKGVNPVALPAAPPTSGPVAAAVSPITATVADLLGSCNVAGFAEYLHVAVTTNNGWARQSQYDASDAVAFVLAP